MCFFVIYDIMLVDNLFFYNCFFKEDEIYWFWEDEFKFLNGILVKFYFDDIDYKLYEEYRLYENGKWNFVFRGFFEIMRLYIYIVYWNWNVKMV